MGGKNDYAAVKPACETLREFGVEFSLRVASAHRTPVEASQIAANADKEGYGVIIGCAGKAAHLAGVLAAHTILPVIGLPILSSTLDGMDSLLSTVQMPRAYRGLRGHKRRGQRRPARVQILRRGRGRAEKEKLIAYKEK